MSTTKHTPGPWNVEHPYGEPGTYIAGPHTEIIAQVWKQTRLPASPDDATEANARVLAAAPEMLEALRVVDALWGVSDAACEAAPEMPAARVRTIIIKAEGGK